jgi:outer membrane protein assembly factor BamD (BamD/ComL family)
MNKYLLLLFLSVSFLESCLTSTPIYQSGKMETVRTDSTVSPQVLYDSAVYYVRIRHYEPAERLYLGLTGDFQKTSEAEKSAYMLGYLYSCSDNPKMDYGKSKEYFSLFLKMYPKSRYVSDSKSWIAAITRLEQQQQALTVCDTLQTENQRLRDEIRSLKQVLEELQKINQKH